MHLIHKWMQFNTHKTIWFISIYTQYTFNIFMESLKSVNDKVIVAETIS